MRRAFITSVYVILFWILLPAILVGSGILLDRGLTAGLSLPLMGIPVGVTIAILAVVMLVVSILQFRRFGRELPISALPPDRLIQRGLFAVWRHPIYLFFLLLVAGIALVLRSGGMLLIVLPLFTTLVGLYIVFEERVLVRRFGRTYVHYRERTPLVVPHLDFMIYLPAWLAFRWLFRFRVLHRERIPDRSPFFIVAAHRNYLDPLFMFVALGQRISFVSTAEMFRRPLSAFLFRRLGTIPKRRFRNDTLTVRGIIRHLRRDGVVGIFPEGERSWTGRTVPWKPEVVHLLKAFPDVPILPVTIEGNYHIWPRWAPGIRRAPLRITFMQPVIAHPDRDEAEFESELRDLVEPDDSGVVCRGRSPIRGIGKLIYRCPVCTSFMPLQETGRARCMCPSCEQVYELLPDCTVRYQSGNETVTHSPGELYDEIRITAADIPAGVDGDTGIGPVAECGSVTVSREQGVRVVPLFTGHLELTGTALRCRHDRQEVALLLSDLRSVTIESNCKLQVYDGVNSTLYQFTFLEESVLKWQDYLVEAIRRVGGAEPNRR